MKIRLSLLGPVQLTHDGRPLRGLRSRKAIALLAYLALREQPVSRTTLAELFWPQQDERRGRANLSWAVNHINKAIPDAFTADRHTIAFNTANPTLWLDTRAFMDLLVENTIQARIDAMALTRGELLEGLWLRNNSEFEMWLLGEQERWRQLEADVLNGLSRHFERNGDLKRAIYYLRRLLDLTPWREMGHRRLIGLLARDGQRSAALAQYEICREILLEELNVEPSPETEQLIAAIRINAYPAARPAAAAEAAPAVHHLPRQFTAFFGRDAELARIDRFLEAPEAALVTIIGPGGAGKTRLALAAGSAQKAHFAHGVHFVPLAGLEHKGQFVPALAEVIGFPFSIQPDRPSPREQLLNYLAQRELLLILDNAEHLRDFHEELLELLQHAPGVKLLVTSRHEVPLQAAAVLHLHGLPYPPPDAADPLRDFPAMQMLLDRVRRRDEAYAAGEWHEALAGICRQVEGYPLALELAAGLTPVESPQEIAGHIARGLDALRVAYHDLPPRHLSLRALFDHSWDLLTAEEKRVLPLLTLFQGGFTAEAARAVTGASAQLLRGLAGKSLLQEPETGRYALHNVPRYFLDERLADESTAPGAHAAYYLTLFQEAAEDLRAAAQLETRQRLQFEEENLRAAWSWICAAGDSKAIVRCLPNLYVYWARRGYAQAGVEFFDGVTSVLQEKGLADLATAVRLHALGCLPAEEAGSVKYLGETLAAAPIMRAAKGPLKLAMAARLARQCADCLTFGMSKAEEVLVSLFTKSRMIVEAAGDDLDMADVYLIQARLNQHESDYASSRRLFIQAVEVYRRLDDWYALADALYQLTRLEHRTGNFAAAARHAGECQALYARLENRQGLQDSHTILGFVAYQEGRLEEAADAFHTSLRLSQELGNHTRTANNLSNLGAVAVDMDQLQAARDWYKQAFALFSELNDDSGVAIVLANQGMLAEKAGNLDQALLFTQKSLAIRKRIGDLYGLSYARNNLGFIHIARKEYEIALEQLGKVLQQGIAAQNINWQADALGGVAIAWANLGFLEEGLELAGSALAEEATGRYVREKLADYLERLDEELPADYIAARLGSGREKAFTTLAQEIARRLSDT